MAKAKRTKKAAPTEAPVDLNEKIEVSLWIGIGSSRLVDVEMTREQYRDLCERIDSQRGGVFIGDAPVDFDDVMNQIDLEVEQAETDDPVEQDREAAEVAAKKARASK